MHKPLRVGLLINSFIQPHWVFKIINDIQSSSVAEMVLVIKNDLDGANKGVIQQILARKQHLLYILYERLDTLIFRKKPDAFESRNIEELVSNCPVVNVNPLRKRYSDYFHDQDIDTILGYDLDVALRFGFRILRGRVLQIAKYGVWSHHHGDNLINRGEPAGFWEVMEGIPVTGSILQILTEELDNGKVIYRSYASTIRYSVKANRNNYYWKTSTFVARKLKDLYETGSATLDGDVYNSTYHPYYSRLYRRPDNLEMLRLLLRFSGRSVLDATRRLLSNPQWFVAYSIRHPPAGVDSTFYKFKPIMPPKDRFWADPFPTKLKDKYFIFVEEYVYKDKKGCISVIEMDQHGVYKAPVKVLDQKYHLSYPFIFEWEGKYYMMPETRQNRNVAFYRCRSFPSEWEIDRVVLPDVNAVDATLAEINGLWWLFVNIAVDGASTCDELYLFYSDTPMGSWRPYKRNPVKSDVRSSRPAGRIFCWNGDYYRPAQDYSDPSACAISINKIVHIDTEHYIETEVSKIRPKWGKGIIGTHTINYTQGLTCIDVLIRRSKI